jgi:plastocyanin
MSCVSNTASEETIANGESKKTEPIVISIYKYKYIPEVLEIKVGQTVRWVNDEKRQYHSVWFEENGEKESVYLFPKEYLDKTFDTAGVYNYRCGPHPEMIAKIIVK